MTRTIPPYDDAHALDFKRGKAGVKRKIMNVYGFSQADLTPDPNKQCVFASGVNDFLRQDDWRTRYEACARFSQLKLDENKIGQINSLAREMMNEYYQYFHLAALVKNKHNLPLEEFPPYPYPEPYDDYENSKHLMDIYAGHVNTECLSRIQSLGFDDRSTYSLAGFIIKNSAIIAGPDASQIRPVMNALATADAAVGNILMMLNSRKQAAEHLKRDMRARQLAIWER